jgi:hypothetical protein
MTTIFVGGSRHVPILPEAFVERLDNVIREGFRVIVGDAGGADTAIQRYLLAAGYRNTTIFCSGARCRNNLGNWDTRHVTVPSGMHGFQFHAAKDREMAREAEFGLMVWDGRSPGTLLNVLRLNQAGKRSVLFCVQERRAMTFGTIRDFGDFLSTCDPKVKRDLRERATPQERTLLETPRSNVTEPRTSEAPAAIADLAAAR